MALTEYVWCVVAGAIFCFTLGFGMGANDVANNFGPSIGARSISLRKALVIAAIFELVGSVGLGSSVTDSVRKGVYDPEAFGSMPEFLLTSALATLVTGTLWLLFASHLGMSVSTTHALIGSMAGCGLAIGAGAVKWAYLGQVALAWVVAPIGGALVGSGFYAMVRSGILRRENALGKSRKLLPLILLYVGLVISFYFIFSNPLVFQGTECEQEQSDGTLQNVKPCLVKKWVSGHKGTAAGVAIGCGFGLALIAYYPVKLLIEKTVAKKTQEHEDRQAAFQLAAEEEQLEIMSQQSLDTADGDGQTGCKGKSKIYWDNAPWNRDLHAEAGAENSRVNELADLTEKFEPESEWFFNALQTLSACLSCLVHGSNDVANAAAPFASIYSIYSDGAFLQSVDVPIWILFLAGSSISIGLMFLGYKVIKSVGIELVHMSAPKGFCVEMGLFTVMIINSFIGMPVSSTHIGIGAMIGVGLIDRHCDPETGEDITKTKWAMNFNAVQWKLAGKMAVAWVATLFVCAAVSYCLYSFAIYSPARNDRWLGCDGTWKNNVCIGKVEL